MAKYRFLRVSVFDRRAVGEVMFQAFIILTSYLYLLYPISKVRFNNIMWNVTNLILI